MSDLPSLLLGSEIKKMLNDFKREQQEIIAAIRDNEVAIARLPPGQGKRKLRSDLDELKQQIGLLPAGAPAHSARDNWSSEKLAAEAVELTDEARKWKAAGRLDKARWCLRKARASDQEAGRRRAEEHKST